MGKKFSTARRPQEDFSQIKGCETVVAVTEFHYENPI